MQFWHVYGFISTIDNKVNGQTDTKKILDTR
jgi:hypothetical protein